MLQSILALIVQSRSSSKDSWKKTLLNLTLIREYTKKYARINDKKEEIVITETGNVYLISNLQDFGKYFVTGNLRGTSRPEVFPIRITDEKNNERSERKIRVINQQTRSKDRPSLKYSSGGSGTLCKDDEAFCLPTSGGGGQYIQQLNNPKHSNNIVYSDKGISPTLNTMQGGNRQPFVAPVLTPDRPNKRQNGRRFKEDGDPSFTLTAQDKHGVLLKDVLERKPDKLGRMMPLHRSKDVGVGRIRRLTPTECERLQGFPDDYTKFGLNNGSLVQISDSQRYKCLGNAVTTNVVQAIIEKIK